MIPKRFIAMFESWLASANHWSASFISGKRLKYLKLIWFWSIALMFGYYFAAYREVIALEFKSLSPEFLLGSAATLLIAKILVSELARWSLKECGTTVSPLHMYYLYTMSDIAKYIPGGIWGVVGRISLYAQNGLELKSSVKALALENVALIFGSLLVGVACLFPSWLGTGNSLYFCVGILLILAPLVGIAFVHTAWARGLRKNLVFILVNQSVSAIFFGVSLWLLFASEFNYNYLLLSIGATSLARGIGLLAVFAPAGLGVREAILIACLGSVLGLDKALFISTFSRVLTIACEYLVSPFVYFWWNCTKRKGIVG